MTIQLVLAALGGLIIGSAMTFAASAQKPPPAYFIAESVVTDPQANSAVIAKLPATAQPYGGRYLARGGRIVSFGGEPPRRVVIVAFDSLAQAEGWRADPKVKALEEERKSIGTTLRHYAVEGLPQ
jgi:uncharacterized protein (DUF1330 family)